MTTLAPINPDARMQDCDVCGGSFDSDTHEFCDVEGGNTVCESCIEGYMYSEIQGTYIDADSAVGLHETDERVSPAYRNNHCYQSRMDLDEWFEYDYNRDEYDEEYLSQHGDGETIYEYHETDAIDALGWPDETPENGLCFGVELEMEHKTRASYAGMLELSQALKGRDGNGKYILMHDGSLNASGVELITLPYTLDGHQKGFNWAAVLDPTKGIGRSGSGTEACGMHVHINRKAISALTLGKMLVFMNSAANSKLVELIAQRDGGQWARRVAKKITDGKKTDGDKYEALHIGHKTIECRIFKGNLRPDRVLKNIEFCHAMVNYARDASMQEVTGYDGFLKWINARKGIYSNLVKFLAEKKNAARLNNPTTASQEL